MQIPFGARVDPNLFEVPFSRWVAERDRKPQDKAYVLMLDHDNVVQGRWLAKLDRWVLGRNDHVNTNVSYWLEFLPGFGFESLLELAVLLFSADWLFENPRPIPWGFDAEEFGAKLEYWKYEARANIPFKDVLVCLNKKFSDEEHDALCDRLDDALISRFDLEYLIH